MKIPATPANESERLSSLQQLSVLDTPSEERFDRITRVAKYIFDVPIVLVSLVDDKRQWFKSRQGLTASETPREISFCGHAVAANEPLVVSDAAADERFRDNPLVTGLPMIRFYAGYPLRDRNGDALGTLCLIDQKPRNLITEELGILEDLALSAQNELNFMQLGLTQLTPRSSNDGHRRKDLLDTVTGLWNRAGTMEILDNCVEDRQLEGGTISLTLIRVEGLTSIEEASSGADMARAEVAQALRGSVRSHDVVGRLSDDEFLILEDSPELTATAERSQQFRDRLENYYQLTSLGIQLSIASCVADIHDESSADEIVLGLRGELCVNPTAAG